MDKAGINVTDATNQDANLINYFTPIDNLAYQDILRYIRENKVEVTFKIYDLHSKSTFVQVDGADLAIDRKFPYDYESTNIFCVFICGGESHFFRSKMKTSEKHFLLTNPEKIYKIQRRANFRFNVPDGLNYEFKILEHPRFKYELRDISLGGCKVLIKTTSEISLPVESDISIWLQLLDFGGVKIDATVAYTKFIQDKNFQIVGIKFGNVDATMLSELHKTLIQVDRISRGKALE